MFLIQTNEEGEVEHDFSFTLLKAIELSNWKGHMMSCMLSDNFNYEGIRHDTVPVGSNEFVRGFIRKYHSMEVKPINIPDELMSVEFTHRIVTNMDKSDLFTYIKGLDGEKVFVKSNEVIKGYSGVLPESGGIYAGGIPPIDRVKGELQVSTLVDIESEWRAFVFKGELVGLQNYMGDFTLFPDVARVKKMIAAYTEAPVAYTLDVGVNKDGTFIIECHDFFSCGLYGFANLSILPAMFSQWFHQFLLKNKHV
jgi:hypothetical protein